MPSHIEFQGNENMYGLTIQAMEDGILFDRLPTYKDVVPNFKRKCINTWTEYFNLRSFP